MNMQVDKKGTPVCHVIKGELVTGADLEFGTAHSRFTTPSQDLNSLVWSRQEPVPALDVPLSEIMDLLVGTGKWITEDPEGLMAEALEFSVLTSPLPRGVIERSYQSLGTLFDRQSMEF